jgi:FkbM family methyltransferase
MGPGLAGADLQSPPDEKLYQLIRPGWTVVVAGVRDDTWLRTCATLRPGAHYHVYPHDSAAHAALAPSLQPFGDGVSLSVRAAGPSGSDGGQVETLDQARAAGRFHHIHFLRIDTPGAAMDIMLGARKLLRHSRIDMIEIAAAPEGVEGLSPLAMLLSHYGYVVLWLEGSGFKRLTQADLAASRWSGQTVAIHTRHLGSFLELEHEIMDLPQLLAQFGISLRGVIHVGAHEGHELPTYLELGATHVLLIEADPSLAERLRSLVATLSGVTVAHCAVNDADGPVDLHLASNAAANSILPLKLHKRMHPNIVERGMIQVPGQRLDPLMDALGLDRADFNLLCLDIQGAELRALRGATTTLEAIEAISVEINFEEVYEGCAQVEDIDEFLGGHGFDRVATLTPYHPSWGDALYVRRNFTLNQRSLQ